MSGPASKPIALRMVFEAAHTVDWNAGASTTVSSASGT
jgi:hypothetical protein